MHGLDASETIYKAYVQVFVGDGYSLCRVLTRSLQVRNQIVNKTIAETSAASAQAIANPEEKWVACVVAEPWRYLTFPFPLSQAEEGKAWRKLWRGVFFFLTAKKPTTRLRQLFRRDADADKAKAEGGAPDGVLQVYEKVTFRGLDGPVCRCSLMSIVPDRGRTRTWR